GWTPPDQSPRAYVPADRRVHYLLHTSLPYSSVGYSTRGHGLMTAVRARGWNVSGLTRPGFPEERLAAGEDVPPSDVVDGVTYGRLIKGDRRFPFGPVDRMGNSYMALMAPLVERDRPGIVHAASNYRNGLSAVAVARRYGLPA